MPSAYHQGKKTEVDCNSPIALISAIQKCSVTSVCAPGRDPTRPADGSIFLECVHCQTDRAHANDRDRTRSRKVLAGVRQRKVKNGVDWHAY
jgi:hypothetical protein